MTFESNRIGTADSNRIESRSFAGPYIDSMQIKHLWIIFIRIRKSETDRDRQTERYNQTIQENLRYKNVKSIPYTEVDEQAQYE